MQAQPSSRDRGRRALALVSAMGVVAFFYGGVQEALDGNGMVSRLNHAYMVLTKTPYLHMVFYVPLLVKMAHLVVNKPQPGKRDVEAIPIITTDAVIRHAGHCISQTLLFSGFIYPRLLTGYVQKVYGVDVSGHFALAAIIYVNMGAMRGQIDGSALRQPGVQQQTQRLCDATALVADVVFSVGLFVTATLKHTILETVCGAAGGAAFSLALRYII